MCGRYFLDTLPELLMEQFRTHKYPVYSASWNIAPTQSAPVLRDLGEGPEWGSLRWGLVPHWAKEMSIGNRLINARAETVAEKPAFRAAFRQRRCIVPAHGFYEWTTTAGGQRQPLAIVPAELPCFGFAGLWERWQPAEGAALETYTILTTQANALMARIHDRMPVILDPSHYAQWLRPGPLRELDFQAPYPAEAMQAWPVSTAVGNPRNNEARLIEPVDARP